VESLEHPVPGPVAAPPLEPVVDRLPGTIAVRQVAPRSARAQEPEYGVEDFPEVASRPAAFGAWREQIFEAFPLFIRQFVPSHAPFSERGLDPSPTLIRNSRGALQPFSRQSLVSRSAWGHMCFSYRFGLGFRDAAGTELVKYAVDGTVEYSNPLSVQALNILTGLSMLVLAPFTVPAIAEIAGDHAVSLAEDALRDTLDRIVADVRRDHGKFRRLVCERRGGAAGGIPKTMPVPASKYDDFLEAVVVIRTGQRVGTGFLVSSDGHILSNSHVVGLERSVSVKLRTGETSIGAVVAIDRSRDLALVKVQPTGLPWLSLAALEDGGIGTDVIAVGTPYGFDWSVSRGIVSAIRRLGDVVVIQTDAAINLGNSGGPLISLQTGRVVGVNTLSFRKDVAEGLGFAVSSQEVLEAFPEIEPPSRSQ